MGNYNSGRRARPLHRAPCIIDAFAVPVKLWQQAHKLRHGDASACDLPNVKVEWLPLPFGGARPWWLCPRCSRRCATLYFFTADPSLACRQCHGLKYNSQRIRPHLRAKLQASKLRARLCCGLGMEDAVLPRKGMHWTTFSRIAGRIDDYEEKVWRDVLDGLQQANAILRGKLEK